MNETEALRVVRPERCLCAACGAEGEFPADAPKAGPACPRCGRRLFIGRFALLEKTGPQEPDALYKAFHADLGTLASLRLFGAVRSPDRAAFFRRAEVLARLDHPSLAAVYGAGEHEDRLYVVSRYVGGTPAGEASLSVRESVAVVRDAALAVDCAHAANVIHGGLSPGNLWIAPSRRAGPPAESLLRVLVDGWGPTPAGQPAAAPGAFAFLSPEQAHGRPADARSDVYSLGASLYALATGRPPVRGARADDVLRAVAQGTLDPPSQANPLVDSSLESIILMSMDRDPGRRYPQASELAQDLTRWLTGGSGIRGPSTRLRERVPEFVLRALESDGRRRRLIFAGLAAGLLLALGGAFLVGSLASRGEAPARPIESPVAAGAGPAAPKADPAPAPAATALLRALEGASEPPTPPASGFAGLGSLFFLHPRFGAFVRLEPDARVEVGDVLSAVRGLEVVGRLTVEMVTSPEPLYPNGCAVCLPAEGAPKPGDVVLRTAK
jgi:hypothetical protein